MNLKKYFNTEIRKDIDNLSALIDLLFEIQAMTLKNQLLIVQTISKMQNCLHEIKNIFDILNNHLHIKTKKEEVMDYVA